MVNIKIKTNNIKIVGNITSIEDFEIIKKSIESVLKKEKSLIIEIIDSIYITSSLVGLLYKLKEKDGIDISIKIGKNELKEVFEDLNLLDIFKISMI
ncbi:hypothetical protein [Nautilia lithotrophica]